MLQRVAIIIGSLAAAGVLAVGLVAAGFGPAQPAAAEPGTGLADVAADPSLEPETVYVIPGPRPRRLVVTRTTPTLDSPARVGTGGASGGARAERDDDEERWERHDREDGGEERDEREREDD
jgi:hypothetical protein